MNRLAALAAAFLLCAPPTFAATLELTGQAVQGALIFGKTDPGASVSLDGNALRVSPDGDFLIAFARDAVGERIVSVNAKDGSRAERILIVRERSFDIQRIDGLPPRQVTPAPADLERIRVEAEQMKTARAKSVDKAYFRSGFGWPADGTISGVYGSQRILNGEPRTPHYGLDIAAPTGTPVRAAADGTIVFSHPGMFFNGKTLVIDHGLGLQSIYLHLADIAVAPGARVSKGQIVARMGATGRVTGAHLHWGLQLGSTYVDPQLVLPPRDKP